MLAPDTRTTLLNALRPPPGYEVGCAVGTTYTLNLDAALTAPAAFALHAVADATEGHDLEPLALLESIRRHAGRYTVFFQAGQVSVPAQRRLFAYLEGALIPVIAPGGGIFHPKVWVLRFDAPGAPSVHRVLCASRNLTLDRAWDTLVRLDSQPAGAGSGTDFDGSGLARFVRALPGLAVGTVPPERREAMAELADGLGGVTWSLPPNVRAGRCVPLGLDGEASLPFPGEVDRLAVVSPFLTNGLLTRLPRAPGRRVLVSRPDQLLACADTVRARFGEVYTLDPDAAPIAEATANSTASTGGSAPTNIPPRDPAVPFDGLHAKLYVLDDGPTATVVTGSANATTAAFGGNVEFVMEFTGPVDQLGVEALLAESADTETLRTFLLPYSLDDGEVEAEAEDPADDRLDALRQAIAAVPITARATPGDMAEFDLTLATEAVMPALPADVEWRCWPITLADATAVPAGGAASLHRTFGVSFEAITSFLANELRLGDTATRFVLTADLVEAPPDRGSRLLRLLLGDADRFIRYLLMLVNDGGSDPMALDEILDVLDRGEPQPWQSAAGSVPLLEALLRSLAQDPARLDEVNRLIIDLRAEPEGDTLLPPGLLDVWEPLWAAAQELAR